VSASQPERGPSATRRTQLAVWVPEAEPLVGPFRARFHASAVAQRVVPHVTVLSPFVAAVQLDDALRAGLTSHFAGLASFDASLDGVGAFAQHVWLAPSPRERFVELIRGTCARFPAHPPYEGLHVEPEPHLTIGEAAGQVTVEVVLEAARDLEDDLPVPFRVDAVWLFEEQHDGTWAVSSRFPLA
jgi:2'-5' RNA ligase